MFLMANGKPKKFFDAVVGGSAVGVPGLVRMLEMVHQEHGNLPWADLFRPAIRIAEKGFPVSSRLAGQLSREKYLRETPAALGYFYHPDGANKLAGTILKNPAFAATMRQIAEGGADAFYNGPIAQSIVLAVRDAKLNKGGMTLKDLANYRAVKRKPVCAAYRAKWVCGMGPPSSGALRAARLRRLHRVRRHLPRPWLPQSAGGSGGDAGDTPQALGSAEDNGGSDEGLPVGV